MTDPGDSGHRKSAIPGSLLSAEAVGGIVAGGGFDFQTRYAACHLPLWLQQGQFHQMLFEGTGDIDIRFADGQSSSRIHIQVKDHEVQPSELKTVVEQFVQADSGMPGVYQQFTLACPGLSQTLRSVETALARFRGAKPFYDDAPEALAATQQELDTRLQKVGLGDHVEFVRAKFRIEVGHGDLRHDERAVELFVSRLLAHPAYAGKLRAMVEPAFAELMRSISARRGVVLERSEIEGVLEGAIRAGGVERPGITIWIHNWTSESFERPADYVMDWSGQFERSTRRVPSQETWNNDIVPELRSLRKQIAGERQERLIRFRGKCALSTGVALGAIFPAVGGWAFEMVQPPAREPWTSDVVPTLRYEIQTEVVEVDPTGSEMVLGLNIKGDGRHDMTRYVNGLGISPRVNAFVSPPSQGGQSIGGSEDACAFALAVRNVLGELVKKYRITRTHVFFYGPLALAVFVGQQLTSIGEIQLYEYQDPGYVPSCLLRT